MNKPEAIKRLREAGFTAQADELRKIKITYPWGRAFKCNTLSEYICFAFYWCETKHFDHEFLMKLEAKGL